MLPCISSHKCQDMLVDAQARLNPTCTQSVFFGMRRLNSSKGARFSALQRHAYKQSLLAVAVGLNLTARGTNMKRTTWHSVCVLLLPKQSANHVTNSLPQATASKLQLANFRTNNKEHTGAEASAMLRIKSNLPNCSSVGRLAENVFRYQKPCLTPNCSCRPGRQIQNSLTLSNCMTTLKVQARMMVRVYDR